MECPSGESKDSFGFSVAELEIDMEYLSVRIRDAAGGNAATYIGGGATLVLKVDRSGGAGQPFQSGLSLYSFPGGPITRRRSEEEG